MRRCRWLLQHDDQLMMMMLTTWRMMTPFRFGCLALNAQGAHGSPPTAHAALLLSLSVL